MTGAAPRVDLGLLENVVGLGGLVTGEVDDLVGLEFVGVVVVHVRLVVHQFLYNQSVRKPTPVSATPIRAVNRATVTSTTIE